MNPNILAGSESEKSLNLDSDSDPDTVFKIKKNCKKSQIKHLKGENVSFSVLNFFLCRTDSRTHIKATRDTILKIFGSKY
jgi:hypothetical protein